MQNLKHLGKQEIDYVIEEARKELAKGTYDDFFEYVNGYKYQVFDHIQLICDKVQKIADGEQHFYIVEMPPRHGKSMAISKTFPAYYLMKNPDKELIAVTYGDDLAVDIGRANRDKFREYGPTLFGLELSYENASNTAWGIAGHTGRMVASGVGGSLTGKGADCLIGSTKVKTTIGDITIEKLVEMENKPLVLSYNHLYNKVEYKKIVATRKVLNDKLIKITTASGNEIISTREHRIYEEGRGYKQAALLRCGNRVKIATIKEKQNMRYLQEREEWPWPILQRVLQFGKEKESCVILYALPEELRERTFGIYEACKKRAKRFLLFDRVFKGTPFLQKFIKVRSVWFGSFEGEKILFSKMQKSKKRRIENTKEVFGLQRSVLSEIEKKHLLFQNMRWQSTFGENDGQRKQLAHEVEKQSCAIFKDFSANKGTRFKKMCILWTGRNKNKENESMCTSYRRGLSKQQYQQFGNDLYSVSHEVPQDYEFCKQDSIIGIEEISGEKQYVYDIQVEGTHNFFANGILVHNCLIVDDPIKNRADAESTLKRERLWDEWESTISTRLQGKASVIIIMTRWHDDDLVGRLLKNSAYPWERLRLPLLSEGEDDLLGRPKGTALCRELGYTEEWAVTKKIDVGTRTWNSLYQQRPTTDGGSIFKEEHFKYFVFNEEQKERYGLGDDVEVLPDMRFMDIVAQSWDCTFKDTKTSDFVAGQVWAKRGAKNYLIDSVRERMGFVDTKNAIIKMSAKHPKATAKYIEDKANGTAIIEILKDEISGIKPITPTESKVSRANAVSAMFEAGNVYFPHPKVFDWVEDITSELKSFPLGAHDDTVDACTQALNELKSKGSSLLDRFRNMV